MLYDLKNEFIIYDSNKIYKRVFCVFGLDMF